MSVTDRLRVMVFTDPNGEAEYRTRLLQSIEPAVDRCPGDAEPASKRRYRLSPISAQRRNQLLIEFVQLLHVQNAISLET